MHISAKYFQLSYPHILEIGVYFLGPNVFYLKSPGRSTCTGDHTCNRNTHRIYSAPEVQVNGLFALEEVGAPVGDEVVFAAGVREVTGIGVGERAGGGVPFAL